MRRLNIILKYPLHNYRIWHSFLYFYKEDDEEEEDEKVEDEEIEE